MYYYYLFLTFPVQVKYNWPSSAFVSVSNSKPSPAQVRRRPISKRMFWIQGYRVFGLTEYNRKLAWKNGRFLPVSQAARRVRITTCAANNNSDGKKILNISRTAYNIVFIFFFLILYFYTTTPSGLSFELSRFPAATGRVMAATTTAVASEYRV